MFPYSLTLRAHAEAVRPCFLRKRPHGKDGYEFHCWIRSIVLVFRIERMTGFEPAVSCLGSRRATTAPHPHGRAFFRIRRTAVTYSPPAERGMAGLRVGLTGFEPATPCSQSTCATKLRHNPLHRYESRTAHHCFLGRFELRLWFPINVSEPLFHPALPVVADAIFLSADRWLYTTTRNRMLGVVFHQAIQPFIPAGTSIPAS